MAEDQRGFLYFLYHIGNGKSFAGARNPKQGLESISTANTRNQFLNGLWLVSCRGKFGGDFEVQFLIFNQCYKNWEMIADPPIIFRPTISPVGHILLVFLIQIHHEFFFQNAIPRAEIP